MKNTYLKIEISGEENIGFIDAGIVDLGNKQLKKTIVNVVEKKLVEALSDHFDCEVKIITHKVNEISPLSIEYDVVVCSLENDYNETVYLDETWLY